ncbi:MAG: O-antigen ligase family protein [Flavobacteriales bacterium]|nr:O-antigen ligase family protein [Flavobacteriales bacterium]
MISAKDFRESFSGSFFSRLFTLSVLISAIWLPITPKGMGYPIGFMVIFWLFTPKSFSRDKGLAVLLFSAIYLFHLVAMLYTEDVDRGIRDLGQKASLFIFPLVFGTVLEEYLPKRKLLFDLFLLGLIFSVGISILDSFIKYSESGLVTDFFMSEFSYSHHPSYLALFLNFGLSILLIENLKDRKKPKGWGVVLTISVFLVLGVIYSASKMGFIHFLFLIGFVLTYWLVRQSLNSSRVAFILSLGVLFTTLFFANPTAKNRIFHSVEVIKNEKVAASEDETGSTVARLTTWELTIDEIFRHPLGVGTGDIQDVLDQRYRKEGFDLLAEKGLNPHNVFLQVSLAQGVVAMSVFLLSLFFAFWKTWKRKDWIYAFFLLSVVIHFMVESMLEKQSGVIFFAMINAYLYFKEE